MHKVRLIIVDDHEIIRDGIQLLLKSHSAIEEIDEAWDSRSLSKVIERKVPDIILLDIELPGKSGIEIANELKDRFPEIKIIFLSAQINRHTIASALQTGAQGYISKHAGQKVLSEAIEKVLAGQEYYDETVSGIVMNTLRSNYQVNSGSSLLTKRECDIIPLIVKGFTHKEIAENLFISRRTVDNHVSNIMNKLSIHSKADIIRFAIKSGLSSI